MLKIVMEDFDSQQQVVLAHQIPQFHVISSCNQFFLHFHVLLACLMSVAVCLNGKIKYSRLLQTLLKFCQGRPNPFIHRFTQIELSCT